MITLFWAQTNRVDLTEKQIRRICHRNYGVGADGILCWSAGAEGSSFTLRIFNPDGSEAEKSGNGLRIFARYLWEQQRQTSNEVFYNYRGRFRRSRGERKRKQCCSRYGAGQLP